MLSIILLGNMSKAGGAAAGNTSAKVLTSHLCSDYLYESIVFAKFNR